MTSIDPLPTPRRLLRLGQVLDLTGMQKSWIYSQIAKGRFPAPVKLGGASVWNSAAVDGWIAATLAEPGA